MPSQLHFHWAEPAAAKRFRTGVSLHSHTMHSKESLDFIPRIARHVPALSGEIDRLAARFERCNGFPLDFRKGWWTPPLDTHGALALESGQIEQLGLRPLVSITDHDTIDGLDGLATPQSVELTVPLAPSFLHIGIHNLPPARAREVFPYAVHPAALMGWLNQFPNVLVVLNHPLWDEAGAGVAAHRSMVERFLARFERDIHALELNGLRPWKENQLVVEMANAWGMPTISGGDRHGLEPNANLNLTNAATFEEFADEVRNGKRSEVLFADQYRRPFAMRIASNLVEILCDQPEHSRGWTRWSERVFYEMQPGEVRSLAEYWPGGEPALIRFFVGMVQVMRMSGTLAPVRFASGFLRECRP
jgi:hypothetical protein